MPGAPRFRVLAFDAYGTLFDVFSVTALAQVWRAKQLQYSLLRTVMGRHRDFWGLTTDSLTFALEVLGIVLARDDRQQLLDAYLTLSPFPDVRPALEALRERGLRLAILSNGAPGMLAAATEVAGIASLIDQTLSVEAVGVFKPSPRAYGLLADAFDVETDDIGFVSSNSWDIAGARSAGLTTFWLRRAATDPPEVLGFPADHTIHSLAALPDVC